MSQDLFSDRDRRRLLAAGYRPAEGPWGGPHWHCPDGALRVQDEAVRHLEGAGGEADSEGGEEG